MRASNIRKTGRSMRELTKAELDQVAGGKIELRNPAGNEPQSPNASNGRPDFENPAGHAPPGHN
jgi:hypothetical protein